MQRTWEEIRDDFPILKETVYGKKLIYLDNAATTQIPRQVIDCFTEHYTRYNANVHRGIHYLSEQSTGHMEAVREQVSDFLHAKEQGKIVFTSGATDSANLVALSFLKNRLKPGDAVISTELEHHANYVVWQQLCRECGADFRVIPTVDGDLDMKAAGKLMDEKTKLLAVTAVSNVIGTIVDLKPLIKLAHSFNIPVYVDAAQAMRHMHFDMEELDCDFLGFSAHKMMGPTGTGCLFIRNRYLDDMRPCRFGGGMVDIVTEEKTTFAPSPACLEAGTPNYSGIIAFGAALDFICEIGLENIILREKLLTGHMEELLLQMPHVQVLGKPKRRAGVISVLTDGVHPYDLAGFIDKYGVAVRTGSMCAQPLVNKYGVQTITRISPAFYNTMEELDEAAVIINRVIEMLRKVTS